LNYSALHDPSPKVLLINPVLFIPPRGVSVDVPTSTELTAFFSVVVRVDSNGTVTDAWVPRSFLSLGSVEVARLIADPTPSKLLEEVLTPKPSGML
jgi:hypothetical protein